MPKDFLKDLNKFIEKLRVGENFSLSRFSDGEIRILQDKKLVLGDDNIIIGDHESNMGWVRPEYEQKEYDPTKHQWVREKLVEALQFKKDGYYKGLSCRCCLSGKHGMSSDEEFNFQVELSGVNKDDEHLTWSNLLLNNNYPLFLEHMLPYFFNYDVVMVVNEHVNLDRVPFPVKKDFRIGNNCMINNYGLVEEIKEYIEKENIENHLFLFSAASLSNFLNHQLYEFSDKNTYIDIGTSLNIYYGLKVDRRYLLGYWFGDQNGIKDLQQKCIW
jgi:hypothetical protein